VRSAIESKAAPGGGFDLARPLPKVRKTPENQSRLLNMCTRLHIPHCGGAFKSYVSLALSMA